MSSASHGSHPSGRAGALRLQTLRAAPHSAERQIEGGTEALNEARFAEARDLLRASFTLVPRYATAFNLGVALRGTGELCEAVALFERLESGELDEPRETREEVRRYLREVSEQAAELRVRVSGPPVATVRVDGREIGRVRADDVFARCTDPGRHVVEASAEGWSRADEAVTLPRGGSELVRLLLEPETPVAAEDGGVFSEPLFWVVTGALVLGAGAFTAWIVLTSERSPTQSPLGVLEI